MWNVLVVDDDPKDRQRIIDGLKDLAHCHIAKTGQQALSIFEDWQKKEQQFDFILLDVTMPDQDGFKVLKSIRSIEESSTPKPLKENRIIMITSFKDSLMENYNMGWDDFITKPVDPKILVERMQMMLSSKTDTPT